MVECLEDTGGSGSLGDLFIEGQEVITVSTGPTTPTVFGGDLKAQMAAFAEHVPEQTDAEHPTHA